MVCTVFFQTIGMTIVHHPRQRVKRRKMRTGTTLVQTLQLFQEGTLHPHLFQHLGVAQTNTTDGINQVMLFGFFKSKAFQRQRHVQSAMDLKVHGAQVQTLYLCAARLKFLPLVFRTPHVCQDQGSDMSCLFENVGTK